MTIDICKILRNSRIEALPLRESLSSGIKAAVASDHRKLLSDTFEAVTQDMGIVPKYAPGFNVFTQEPKSSGIMRRGFFSPWIVNINDFELMHEQHKFETYMDSVKTMYHETRHFVQSVMEGKNRNFGDRLTSLLSLSPLGFSTRFEKAIPPLSEAQKKLATRMREYNFQYPYGYETINSHRELTPEYLNDPSEIDANNFAAQKMRELWASIGEAEPVQKIVKGFSNLNKPIKFKNIDNSGFFKKAA